MCFTPAAVAACTAFWPRADSVSPFEVIKNSLSTPAQAASRPLPVSRSPMMPSTPSGNLARLSSERLKARTDSPFASKPATVGRPTLPVAPMTRIVMVLLSFLRGASIIDAIV
jgi:hypothetical protein